MYSIRFYIGTLTASQCAGRTVITDTHSISTLNEILRFLLNWTTDRTLQVTFYRNTSSKSSYFVKCKLSFIYVYDLRNECMALVDV